MEPGQVGGKGQGIVVVTSLALNMVVDHLPPAGEFLLRPRELRSTLCRCKQRNPGSLERYSGTVSPLIVRHQYRWRGTGLGP